jgi:hypothetical protein
VVQQQVKASSWISNWLHCTYSIYLGCLIICAFGEYNDRYSPILYCTCLKSHAL